VAVDAVAVLAAAVVLLRATTPVSRLRRLPLRPPLMYPAK